MRLDLSGRFVMTEHRPIHPRVPRCTYRLQFNRDFTFAQARDLVGYFDQLGISDAYASPLFQASAGSPAGMVVVPFSLLLAMFR